MKNSDAEIEKAEMLVLSGNVTVAAACEQLGITKPTYYRRLRQVKSEQMNNDIIRDNVTITIERLDESAKTILDTLETMLRTGNGYDIDKHDTLDVLKTTIGLITNYRSALQKATFMIDARQQTINISNVPPEVLDEIRLSMVNEVINRFRGKLCERCRRQEI